MDAHTILYHPALAGLLTDEMIRVVHRDQQNKEWLGEVDIRWGQNSMRPYRVKGQLHMLFIETYDILVFGLLRELFGIGYPSVTVADYRPLFVGDGDFIKGRPYQNPVALIKKMDDRPIAESDYWPVTDENMLFRYRLGILVIFCKIVGAPFVLNSVRVQKGIPFLWRVDNIGIKSAVTLNRHQFSDLFGFKEQELFKYYEQRDAAKESNPMDSLLIEMGMMLEPVPTAKKPQALLFDAAIKYIRDIDFDMDILREIVHLRENPVRGRISGRGRLKLSKPASQIISLIEENYSAVTGPTPISLFRF
jgi:hypothetical protein